MSISGSSPVQISGEFLPKGIAGTEQEAFHRRNADSEHVGDFLIGHSLVTTQHHGQPLLLSEGSHRGLHRSMKFVIQYPAVGTRRGIGKFWQCPLPIILRHNTSPGTPPRLVEDETLRDGHHPGRHLGLRPPSGGRSPDIEKNLLGHILGISRSDHPGHRPDHEFLMTLHQDPKGCVITVGDGCHQLLIRIFGNLGRTRHGKMLFQGRLLFTRRHESACPQALTPQGGAGCVEQVASSYLLDRNPADGIPLFPEDGLELRDRSHQAVIPRHLVPTAMDRQLFLHGRKIPEVIGLQTQGAR